MCVRTLRTQQRTESQCQLFGAGLAAAHFAGADIVLVHYEIILTFQICERLLVFETVIDQVSSHAFGGCGRFLILLIAAFRGRGLYGIQWRV